MEQRENAEGVLAGRGASWPRSRRGVGRGRRRPGRRVRRDRRGAGDGAGQACRNGAGAAGRRRRAVRPDQGQGKVAAGELLGGPAAGPAGSRSTASRWARSSRRRSRPSSAARSAARSWSAPEPARHREPAPPRPPTGRDVGADRPARRDHLGRRPPLRRSGRRAADRTRRQRQARQVVTRLSPLAPDVVLTSPLDRCRSTAEAIAAAASPRRGPRCPVVVDDRLTDQSLGDWTGCSESEIAGRLARGLPARGGATPMPPRRVASR